MSGQESGSARKRKSKWDIPGDLESGGGSKVEPQNSVAADATQRARERAAQLAAKLAAEGKLATCIAPPPILVPPANLRLSAQNASADSSNVLLPNPEIVKLDSGGYMADFEINDLPARVNLTKKAVQEKISLQSGAAIATKGRYVAPEEKHLLAATGEKPLYLSIQAPIQAKVQVSVHMIKDVIRNFGKAENIAKLFNGSQNTGLSYIQDKIFVGLENISPDYNARFKLEGPNGTFLQHIIAQTGAKVHLRGKGSGYTEASSGRESFEPLHIYISHPNQEGLNNAKSLCENLLQSVHNDFKNWSQALKQSAPFSQQGFNQPMVSGYGQQPISYPTYNRPPPNYNSSQGNMTGPNMPMLSTGYPQHPLSGQYQPRNYPPPQYPQQPPPPFPPAANSPSVIGYPHQAVLAGHGPPFGNVVPPSDRDQPPADVPIHAYSQRETESSSGQRSGSPGSSSSKSENQTERKRRRFTEAPELIRKPKADEIKESPSHSLDSNTKFRSAGEDSREISRDHSRWTTDDDRDTHVVKPHGFSSSTKNKPKENVGGFKAPVLPLSAVIKKKKTASRKPETKNPLSSLIPYGEDSDSDED